MRLFRRSTRGNVHHPPSPADEDPLVRQYRYLLRTAPADALEHVHHEALAELSSDDRAAILRTVREQLLAGQRLEADDVPALSRLVVLGERRPPGALLHHCPPAVLARLADKALVSEAAFGLLTGYAAWDGREPEPPPEEEWQARQHRSWNGRADDAYTYAAARRCQ